MSGAASDRFRATTTPPSPLNNVVSQLLSYEKNHPVSYKRLRRSVASRCENQPDGVLRAALASLIARAEVIELGGEEYFLAANLTAAEGRICAVLAAFHATYPYERGMSTGEIKKRFSKGKTLNARRNVDPRLFELAMRRCRESGRIEGNGDGVRLSTFAPTAAQADELERLTCRVLDYVGQRRFYTVDLTQMSSDLDLEPRRARSIVTGLLKSGDLVRYGEDRFIESPALTQIKSTLVDELSRSHQLTTQEIKELLAIPRNAIIPLLEHLDAAGFTRREGNFRTLTAAR